MTPNVLFCGGSRRRLIWSEAGGPSAATKGWAASQNLSELVRRNIRLAQDASKGADLDLTVHRHHAASRSAPHDDVTSRLTNFSETETLKGFDDCRP